LCSKHNDNTWTVPGGNVEAADSSLLGTATREAMEELGAVPPFEVKAQILIK
jgi:8-oxo-dGTP pyrophosphatase MutT (NUDIX family)